MSQRIGIRQNSQQRIISGARVAFDPRSTEEVEKTRDSRNYKAEDKPFRAMNWRLRQSATSAS